MKSLIKILISLLLLILYNPTLPLVSDIAQTRRSVELKRMDFHCLLGRNKSEAYVVMAEVWVVEVA